MDIFYDAATRIDCQPVLDWKAAGKPVVGYTCSYVPPEIFYAAGILPIRLRGIETEGTDVADTYFGPFICSFPKCILQHAGKGRLRFLDGVIITPGCDSMRRLDECWRKAGEDYEGIVPDFFYYFDVPHKSENHGFKWYLEETSLLVDAVEKHFGVKVTRERLAEAIQVFNRGRRLMRRLENLRRMDPVPVTGAEAFSVAVAGTILPRDLFNTELEKRLAAIGERSPTSRDGTIRIMVAGSVSDETDLFELIEETENAVVVAENLCFGVRYEGNGIPETGDPLDALAMHYLAGSVCPRMFGRYQERLGILRDRIERAGVDGVIMQNIRFCDLHGAENALFEKDLEALGIPCLRIEREYGPHIDTGRMRLRIGAFLERIRSRGVPGIERQTEKHG